MVDGYDVVDMLTGSSCARMESIVDCVLLTISLSEWEERYV